MYRSGPADSCHQRQFRRGQDAGRCVVAGNGGIFLGDVARPVIADGVDVAITRSRSRPRTASSRLGGKMSRCRDRPGGRLLRGNRRACRNCSRGRRARRCVMPANVFPVRDASGVDVGKLGKRQAVDRVVVVDDYRQRVNCDGETRPADRWRAPPRSRPIDVARGVGDVDAVDQRRDPVRSRRRLRRSPRPARPRDTLRPRPARRLPACRSLYSGWRAVVPGSSPAAEDAHPLSAAHTRRALAVRPPIDRAAACVEDLSSSPENWQPLSTVAHPPTTSIAAAGSATFRAFNASKTPIKFV